MIKVLHVTISAAIGGGPEHIFQLLDGLPKDKFENHIACPNNGPYYLKFKEITQNKLTLLPFRKFSIKYLLSLYRYVKDNKIDVLHGHGKGAGFYCRIIRILHKVNVVHTPHGLNQNNKKLTARLYLFVERQLSNLIDAIIFVSDTERDFALRAKMWEKVKSYVIFNGTRIFSKPEINIANQKVRSLFNWNNEKIIITASRFDYQKNTIEFCEIAQKLPQYKFVVLGDGDDAAVCKQYCNENNISNVEFIGNVLNPIEFLMASNIYLSTARWEGLSMAILEAMSVGLPIVASKVVGNIDLVKDGVNGHLYNLHSISEAVSAISIIGKDENYPVYSTEAKRFHNNNLSAETMCLKTASVYLDLIKSNEK